MKIRTLRRAALCNCFPALPMSESDATPPRSSFRVGGMLVGYYVLCPRKAWLSMRALWMEQESTTVALGRHVDTTSYERERKEIMLTAEAPDGTPLVGKVDWARLDAGVLHETKKSASAEEAQRARLPDRNPQPIRIRAPRPGP